MSQLVHIVIAVLNHGFFYLFPGSIVTYGPPFRKFGFQPVCKLWQLLLMMEKVFMASVIMANVCMSNIS